MRSQSGHIFGVPIRTEADLEKYNEKCREAEVLFANAVKAAEKAQRMEVA